MGNDEAPDAFADRVIGSIQRHAIADMFIRALVLPVETPPGSPPDPLTQKKTYDALVARGIVSTGEDRMSNESFDKNASAWMEKFRASAGAGVVSAIHAEDYSILTDAQDRLMSENNGVGGTTHNLSQALPIIGEVFAVERSVAISEATERPSLSTTYHPAGALKVVEDAERRGLPVYGETRPEYLAATAQKYQQPDVNLWLGAPPMRELWDQDMLWDGIRRGVIHTIGTDHSGFPKETKLDPTQTVADRRMGVPNLQDYPPMMFSAGILGGPHLA